MSTKKKKRYRLNFINGLSLGFILEIEFILDLYDDFKDIEYRIDPIGPMKGSYHVIRAYERSKGKLDRSDCFDKRERNNFRVVIKAKDIID